ncbi:hypothetical protein M569_08751, partial [Genlisea aurea]
QLKLPRSNNSSFVLSSPTVRSSVHGSAYVSEIGVPQGTGDSEEQKSHGRTVPDLQNVQTVVSVRFVAVLILILLSFYSTSVLLLSGAVSSSESLLLALILIAFLLFCVSKNEAALRRKVGFCNHLCDVYREKLGFRFRLKPRNQQESLQWFIQDSTQSDVERNIRITSSEGTVREWVIFYSNGDIYEGEFHRGRCNGSGVYNYFAANGRYEGDWIDGKYDGYGVESWSKGSGYRGQYRQGLRHGYGVYKFYTGDSFSGEWCNGQSHGVGIQTCADGSCYVGEFKFGVKHGLGCYHFRNGDTYSGEYFEDKIHGFGIYRFSNGHSYEGSWHEGRKQGYGAYSFRNGDTKSGEWDAGILKLHLSPQTDQLHRALHGARTCAVKAAGIPRLDYKVDRAVANANRAATAARVAAVRAVQNR